MPLPLTGTVGPPSNVSAGDGVSLPLLQGKQSELMTTQLHGKYYTQAYRGNLFYGASAATGLATSAFSNTTYVGLLLWNPTGSGKNLVPVRAVQSRILATTTVCVWGHAYLANAGAGLGTAISAFTTITNTRGPCNNPGITGQGNSVALVGGGATLGTAFGWGRANGMCGGTNNTAVVEQVLIEEFDGLVIIPPGTVMAVFASSSAQIGTYAPSIIWEEVPL